MSIPVTSTPRRAKATEILARPAWNVENAATLSESQSLHEKGRVVLAGTVRLQPEGFWEIAEPVVRLHSDLNDPSLMQQSIFCVRTQPLFRGS